MSSVNKCIFIGTAGKDAETRKAGDAMVANFSIAVSENYKDKSDQWQQNTEWINITAWRNLAEKAEKWVKKGAQVYVEGKLKTRSWEKDGEKKYITEIVADNIQILGKKEKQEEQQGQTSARQDKTPPPFVADDDLPF